MKNALILGTGFVGTALANHWQGKFNVEGTTTKTERIPELMKVCQSVKVLQGNDLNGIKNAVVDKDVIVICIAPKHTFGGHMDYKTTYLESALTLQEALRHSKTHPHIIYTSSTGVYNKEGDQLLSEATLAFSENPNHKILKATEDVYLELMPQLPVTILRLSQIIGPSPRDFSSGAAKMAGKTFPSNGQEYPNVIHVDDIVKGISHAIDNNLTGIYNLSRQLKISRRQIYDNLCRKLNFEPIQFGNSATSNSQIISDKILETGFAFDDNFYAELEKLVN